jgi:UDP-arabinose 4-epimerase
MSLQLGDRPHSVHKVQSLLKVRKSKLAVKVMLIGGSPLRDTAEEGFEFFSLQGRYAAAAGNTLFVGELFSHCFLPTSNGEAHAWIGKVAILRLREVRIAIQVLSLSFQSTHFPAPANRLVFILCTMFYSQDAEQDVGKERSVVILVVGGAGYIGSHTARALRCAGHDVVIFDNLSTGYEFLAAGFELVKGDILDQAALAGVLPRIDAIMHFAAHAYVGESVINPKKYFHNNVEGGLSLLNAALHAGVNKIIFSSTCAVYGEPAKIPIAENIPRQPVNPYGVSKLFFEQALEAYDRAYAFRFASLRYFNAAGADDSGEIGELHDPETHLIPLALQAAAGSGPELQIFGSDYPTPDGTCIRDYIHVNDLASAHVKALDHLAAGGASFAVNVGTGVGASVEEVISAVEKITSKRVPRRIVPRRPGDPPALVADPSKAQALLGWRAERDLENVVSTAWNWIERSRETAVR